MLDCHVFSDSDPRALEEKLRRWLQRASDVGIVSVTQSETPAGASERGAVSQEGRITVAVFFRSEPRIPPNAEPGGSSQAPH